MNKFYIGNGDLPLVNAIAYTIIGLEYFIGVWGSLKEPHFLEDTTSNTLKIANCVANYMLEVERLVFVLITETNSHLNTSTFTMTA